MEDTPTCPICFEKISDSPEGDVDVDVVEVNRNNEHKISATVPCGHIFHHDCIHKWLYSGHSHVKNCPTCNLRFNGYVDLFINPSIFGGMDLDDDVSLSSSDDDERLQENQINSEHQEDEDDNFDPKQNVAVAEATAEETSNCKENKNGLSIEIVDLCRSDDEDSITVQPLAPSNPKEMISQKRPLSSDVEMSQQRSFSSSTSTSVTNEKREEEIQRLTNIAKHHKKRSLQMQKESKQQEEQITNLLQQLKERDETVSTLKATRDNLLSDMDEVKSSLDRSRYTLLRVTGDRDSLKEENGRLKKEKDSIMFQLKTLKECHQKDLDEAWGKSMHEYRQMTAKIRELEQRQVKYTSGMDNVDAEGKTSKISKSRLQLVREFSIETNSNRKNNWSISDERKLPSKVRIGDESTSVRKVNAAMYSSNAARMMGASSQQRERKTQLEIRNAAVREMVDPPTRTISEAITKVNLPKPNRPFKRTKIPVGPFGRTS
ncbi:ring finger domain containing protein [Nitzschia inconspicua]|uniref:Ring finger domain containing protein n=1 Tax=Nitzschia inconspicua TaxID=303405 RepID=A0A9K3PUR2_9STRA|nr:ring finger domain containing protein [Nitzschia inconspicua]